MNRKGDSAQNPVVLKTKEKGKDNGKRCDFCIAKGWKGMNHVESECYTKKRENSKEKGKTGKTKEEDQFEEEDGVSISYVKVKGAHATEPINHFEYDTGTSHHTTNRIDLLEDIEEIHMAVEAYNKTISVCKNKGTLTFKHNGAIHRLQNCLYDPNYSNLISGQCEAKYTLECEDRKAKLSSEGQTIYEMKVDSKGAMWMKVEKLNKANIASTRGTEEIIKMHERYGHISYDTLKTLPECAKIKKKPRCEACEKGKTTKPAAKRDGTIRTSKLLERLHTDLVGPIKPVTPSKQYRYLLVVTDDFSRCVTTTTLRTNDETTDKLISIINALEQATIHHVTQIQADWGGEFHNKDLSMELKQRGITLKETVPRYSETNAVAERANRTIFTMSRTAILATNVGLPKSV